jgi:hypothetical protein
MPVKRYSPFLKLLNACFAVNLIRLKIKVVTDGRDNPVEVVLGGIEFRVAVIIHGDHEIALLVEGLVEVQGHRIDAVIEIVDRKDQFMLVSAFRATSSR